MKKTLSLFLCCLLLTVFAACNGGTSKNSTPQNGSENSEGVTQDNYGDWMDNLID